MAKKFPLQTEGFHPFGDLIGLMFTKLEKGYSQCTLNVEKKLMNPHGFLHGGVMYSMADTGMGAALYSLLEENELLLLYMYQSPINIVLGKRLLIHLLLKAITDPHISNEIFLLDLINLS